MTTASLVIQTPPTGPDAPPPPPVETPKDQAAPAAERPAWLPEKFKSPEDMAKAYGELEKKLGAPPKEEAKPTEETPKEPPKADDKATEDAKKELEKRGVSFDKFADKFATAGKLEDTDYAELEAAGVPRTYVDAFIAGQVALSDNVTKTLFETAGGEDKYGEMIAWAKTNLPKEAIESYNKVMDSGDMNSATLAIKGLRAQFEESNGSPPPRTINGDNSVPAAGDVFKSWPEVSKAMADPRYKKDPAYRAEVTRKLGRSKV